MNAKTLCPPLASFPNLCPDHQFVKMTYSDYWPLATGGASYSVNVFRSNSIFDPDLTGAGGVPCGSNWSTIYGKYRVWACDVDITFSNTSTTQPALAGFYLIGPNGDATVSAGVEFQQRVLEGTNATSELLGTVGSTRDRATLSRRFTSAQIYGESFSITSADNAAKFGVNPANTGYVVAGVVSPDATAIGLTVGMLVKLTYYVEIFEKNLAYVD